MLIVENLVKAYRETLAVRGLSFTVQGGEILGLLGPNGAGKTTVLRSICGIVQINEGRIVVAGHDLRTDEVATKRAIAFVPEVPNPFEMLTVREHLQFIALAYGLREGLEERSQALLERFDLQDRRQDLVGSLSKGMKQKLAVACAFMHDAQVLLLDEPLIGIDPRGARELKALLTEARDAGRAILVSTHMLDTAERFCDRILILNRGQKVAEGTLAELHQRARMGDEATLEDVFLTLTQEQETDADVVVSPSSPVD
jgi:ABC-2 type transport system ATP-binding protein